MKKTAHLFVYGTLRPPLQDSSPADSFNYPKVMSYLVNRTPAKIHNAEIYDMGAYPAAVPGSGVVLGEILELDPAAFTILDPLEGHPYIFVRTLVEVETDEGPTKAWIYWAPEDMVSAGLRINNGDWLHR